MNCRLYLQSKVCSKCTQKKNTKQIRIVKTERQGRSFKRSNDMDQALIEQFITNDHPMKLDLS